MKFTQQKFGELCILEKIKLNLAIALSHGAKLQILDEPTSGLDPVSRDELLEIFRYLAKEGIAILFSTHITSDSCRCIFRLLWGISVFSECMCEQ